MPMPSHNVRRILAARNLPMRMPWQPTLLIWLALDHWHAPGWLWGAAGLFLVAAWVCFFHDAMHTHATSLDDLAERS